MNDELFLDMAMDYVMGKLLIDQIEDLWVMILFKPERLEFLLVISHLCKIINKYPSV